MSDLRNTGDTWVTAPDGNRYWGRFGAAGLLVHDHQRGVLLQHRVSWSDHGGTWGIPGGAIHEHETPLAGALRESAEEAAVPADAIAAKFTHVLDREVWQYTTVIATVTRQFTPKITDQESHELRWVPVSEVDSYALHPAFQQSWPVLQALLTLTPTCIIDAANVVGSKPDGWWKDRFGANERLRDRISALSPLGAPASLFKEVAALAPEITRVYPEWILVTEGAARTVADAPGISVRPAPGIGDDAIIACTQELIRAHALVTVVTSDAELRTRAQNLGAQVIAASAFRTQIIDKALPTQT